MTLFFAINLLVNSWKVDARDDKFPLFDIQFPAFAAACASKFPLIPRDNNFRGNSAACVNLLPTVAETGKQCQVMGYVMAIITLQA
jgi:hypothetical protein